MRQEKPTEPIELDPAKPCHFSTLAELAAAIRIYQAQLERQRRTKLL